MLNAAVFIILSLCWITPDHIPPWFAFHSEAPAFAASGLCLLALVRRKASFTAAPVAVQWCAIPGMVMVFQWSIGRVSYGGDVWVVVAYLMVFVSACLWALNWAKADGSDIILSALCFFLIAVGLVTSFQLLAQWLQVDGLFEGWVLDMLPKGRPRANLGQPNQAATTIVLAMVATAMLVSRRRIGFRVAWLLLLVLIVAATITQSRTALLSALVLTVCFTAVAVLGPYKVESAAKAAVAVWFILFLGAAWAFTGIDIGEQSASLGAQEITNPGTRPLIWRQLGMAVLEKPWLGWGGLQVSTAQQFGALSFAGNEQANYAHNILLDGLVMFGTPVTALSIGAAIVWLNKRRWHIVRSVDTLWCFALALPIVIHALLEYPHAYAYYVIHLGVLAGVMEAGVGGREAVPLRLSTAFLAALAVGWVALIAALGYEYTLAEEDFRMNRFENRRIGSEQTGYHPPHLMFLTQLGDQAHAMRLRAVRGMPAEDVDILNRVAKRFTWGPIQFRAALALGLNGRPQEATERLRVIKNLFAADVYAEARDNFETLRAQKYPELGLVELP
jgi:O-antigen ligase